VDIFELLMAYTERMGEGLNESSAVRRADVLASKSEA
jgi:hypothetical protein